MRYSEIPSAFIRVRGRITRMTGICIAALGLLSSCATEPKAALWDLAQPKETLEQLCVEVTNAGWEIKESLPELKYVQEGLLLSGIETTNLLSADGHRFTVLVMNCPAMSFPGNNFALAYLRDPTGAIVDWKSQWLYNRKGNLKTKILDVNYDGVPDFCFVCEPFRRSQQLLSGFCVRNGKFEPVIAQDKSYFHVEFQETTLKDGIVILPQLKGGSWQIDKLYEIPIKVINRSEKPVDLRGRYVWVSPTFYGSGSYGALKDAMLKPGAALDTVVTVRFSHGLPDRKFGFELTPKHESP